YTGGAAPALPGRVAPDLGRQRRSAEVSGGVVREGAGQLAVGLGLGEQSVRLRLERLHGVGAGSEAGRWLFQRSELHEGLGELGGVAALLAIHAAPSGDDLLRALRVI